MSIPQLSEWVTSGAGRVTGTESFNTARKTNKQKKAQTKQIMVPTHGCHRIDLLLSVAW